MIMLYSYYPLLDNPITYTLEDDRRVEKTIQILIRIFISDDHFIEKFFHTIRTTCRMVFTFMKKFVELKGIVGVMDRFKVPMEFCNYLTVRTRDVSR